MSPIPALDCLSLHLPLTAWLGLPLLGAISVSLLGLAFVLVRLYIELRRQRRPVPTSLDSNPWHYSNMEKSDGLFSDTLPATACDILRPLSQSGPFPSSGILAAQAREQQIVSSNFEMGGFISPETTSETVGLASKCNESVQQMREEDAEGVRFWKRVVVEYN
ncbi:uncharacterized protein N7511_003374 [Penicillium nucicola]|uniref:uncharacterized protein n=1 Tax=Penicillium nucicola TaxID=1850975 RepID=UPI002544F3C6|nr:uncharacterized protein N7511_003374 [Penicillium nucicola]KAJ5771323.1 hypothetical protein N7511_003374 [Penicillium nucicola]